MKRLLISVSLILSLGAMGYTTEQAQTLAPAKIRNTSSAGHAGLEIIQENLSYPGLIVSTGSIRLAYRTKAQVAATTPGAAGEILYCANCTNAHVCVSTGTGKGAFAMVSSTASNMVCE